MRVTELLGPVLKGINTHAKKEGAATVKTIRLKIGQFLDVKEAPLRKAFAALVKGTISEGAKLELTYFLAYRIEVVSFDID